MTDVDVIISSPAGLTICSSTFEGNDIVVIPLECSISIRSEEATITTGFGPVSRPDISRLRVSIPDVTVTTVINQLRRGSPEISLHRPTFQEGLIRNSIEDSISSADSYKLITSYILTNQSSDRLDTISRRLWSDTIIELIQTRNSRPLLLSILNSYNIKKQNSTNKTAKNTRQYLVSL